ncbi:MAG TPA: peptidoglycan DD-metalloendopeptidase family protein [Vicinamibacteria bacterium]|nr:peptidoglycan DD-metalloendopeptidase family protein [Vicinamibacteria bacterium]
MPPLLLVLALAQAPASPAAAESPGAQRGPDDERLRRIQERKAAIEKDLARLRGQERSLLGEVERLELEVRLRTEELREIQTVLDRTNRQLDVVAKRTGELDTRIAAERPGLRSRARALYKLGELSYLRILLSVDRPSEVFQGYRFVSTLARRDSERIAGFRKDLADLQVSRAELERKTQEALTLRADLDRARRTLDQHRERKVTLLREIVEKKETHTAFLDELKTAEGKLQQLLLGGLIQGEVSAPMAAFKGVLPWPVAGKLRVGFGRHKHPRFDTYTIQNGIEVAAKADDPVQAVHEGTVVFADRFLGYGLLVVLDHGGKQHTLYARLAEIKAGQGQRVAAGDVLGSVGAGLEGPGLYFEVRFQGKPEDPLDWLRPLDER